MTNSPNFHGLFMGVNRHLSPAVNELSFAERDARAMHALFTDTLGGGELLLGEQVTKDAVAGQLEALSTCESEDVVVISFSGHGSRTHELVTYDTDPSDLASTAIPLAHLTELFQTIPARHLICILDCCFSGEMGAKVLQAEAIPRNLESEATELERMAGRGRLILTATAQQPAWEYSRFQHGLLTHHLLEALQGAPEIRRGERLPVLSLLQYVTSRVADTAAGFGSAQDPTLRGELDGELSWPVMKSGPAWAATFPELSREPVTEDLDSLAAYGFPDQLMRLGVLGSRNSTRYSRPQSMTTACSMVSISSSPLRPPRARP